MTTVADLHAALEERAAQSALLADGGVDAGRLLVARAESARSRGELDSATELLRAALELAPTDPLAPYLLGDLLEERGETDEAFLRMRQAAEHLSALKLIGSEALAYESGIDLEALLQDRLQTLDNGVARGLASLQDDLALRAEESARSLLADGLPTAALYTCHRAQRVYGATPGLTRFARELVDRHGADPRQWRRLDSGQHNEWLGGTRGWSRDDDSILLSSAAAEILRHHYEQPGSYRLEVELDYLSAEGEHPMAGLAFALDTEGRNIVLGVLPHSGRAALLALGRSAEVLRTFDTDLELSDGERATLSLEIGDGRARLEMDGQPVAECELQDDWSLERLGLYGQAGEFAFQRLRILHE